jgi:hypothetical protein
MLSATVRNKLRHSNVVQLFMNCECFVGMELIEKIENVMCQHTRKSSLCDVWLLSIVEMSGQ